MPIATEPQNSLARIMIYGAPKTRKTWWAIGAATAGFNTILLDGDDGHHIVSQIPDEARQRIGILKLVDDFDNAHFYNFLVRLSRGKDFAINETTRKAVIANQPKQWKDEDPHVLVRPKHLTRNDVIIIDSWTALCSSMSRHYNKANQVVDIDAEKQEWDDYAWAKRFSSKLLSYLHALPCHVVVICHSHIYEKYEGQGRNRKLISQTEQPVSYSGPQGAILAKEFSDILYTYMDHMKNNKISTRKLHDRAGGSRTFAPQEYKWEELDWQRLLTESKGVYATPERTTPEYNSEGIQFFNSGDFPHELYGTSKTSAQQQVSGKPTLVAPTGSAAKINLLNKK